MNQRIHLLSCGSCRRQLDVTNLEIGDQVQCVCDALLTVGPPQQVTIRGLACGRCGGAIGAADEDCSFCGALLSAEDREQTTLCPLCATRLPNDSLHCKSCGCELRSSALPPLPKDGQCPRCEGDLRVHLLDHAEVIECSGCKGVWCSRETFERLQRHTRRAAATGASDAPEETVKISLGAPEGAKSQYIPCLSCGKLMQRRMFRHDGRGSGLVLDICRNHGVWFDPDELEHALRFVRSAVRRGSGLDGSPVGPDRSQPSGPVVTRGFASRMPGKPSRRDQKSLASDIGEGLVEALIEYLSFLPWID